MLVREATSPERRYCPLGANDKTLQTLHYFKVSYKNAKKKVEEKYLTKWIIMLNLECQRGNNNLEILVDS